MVLPTGRASIQHLRTIPWPGHEHPRGPAHALDVSVISLLTRTVRICVKETRSLGEHSARI